MDNSALVVDDLGSVATAYAYELRQGTEVISTGRLTADERVEVGQELSVAGIAARVDEVAWAGGELRLVLHSAFEEREQRNRVAGG